MCKKAFGIPLALVLAVAAVGQHSAPGPSGGISGVVRYPDGTPSSGATAYAVSECKGKEIRLVHQVRTSTDGSFFIPPFVEADCNLVRLSADKKDDLWMKTGRDIFDEKDNGTTPIVEVPRSGSPTTAEITLGRRGALVSLRVRDTATNRFIWTLLHVERMPASGLALGSEDVGTGRDGSADTLLLPAGQYQISVDMYECNEAKYIAVSAPRETLTVEAGQRIAKDISVDVRIIKPAKTKFRGAPRWRPCKP
jgi:hypothetical protein